MLSVPLYDGMIKRFLLLQMTSRLAAIALGGVLAVGSAVEAGSCRPLNTRFVDCDRRGFACRPRLFR